jgi:hypothetical protein
VLRRSENGQTFRSGDSDGLLSHIKASIAWRPSVGGGGGSQAPQPDRGARQRAGLTPAAASNTLSFERETLHQTSSGRSNSLTPITVSTATTDCASYPSGQHRRRREFSDRGRSGGDSEPRGLPIPRQKVCDLVCWVIRQPCQHVGEPSLWIDVVELACLCRAPNYAERLWNDAVSRRICAGRRAGILLFHSA